MRVIAFVLIIALLSGCGYRPSAKFSRAVVGEKISTSVNISLIDPENTVIIKDAVDAAIIKVFHASLVPKTMSQTHLILSLSDPSYAAIQYDSDGFIVAYRATVLLKILRKTADISKNYVVKGTYDFSVTPNAIITDKERFDAIKFSSEKAIRAFVAQVSAEGARKKSNENRNAPDIEEKEVSTKSDVTVKKSTKSATSVNSRLEALEKAHQMKIDGLISDEEFEKMKYDILVK